MITFLWAQTKDGIIGSGGKLPWNIKEEMRHFTSYTKNKAVLMGRNTWDSLSIKPLPNRKNIVITSRPLVLDESVSTDEFQVTSDLENAIKPYLNNDQELVVIGGKQIFDSLIDQVNKLVISIVDDDYQGDTIAPNWNQNAFELESEKTFDKFKVLTYNKIIA